MEVNLTEAEKQVLRGLKDFQRATVERVFSLYKEGQNRVLVADEVGLGKTLVARGVIAKTAKWHKEIGDNLFKVVYICSNQNIANQNIYKLRISRENTVDGVTDTRLSMQHLKIFEQENDQELLEKYIQLIPLTPDTSFRMTSGSGSVEERALMFAILRRMPQFSVNKDELEIIMKDYAFKAWETWAKSSYENRVAQCDRLTSGKPSPKYTESMKEYLMKVFNETEIDKELIRLCKQVRANGGNRVNGSETNNVLSKLRVIFAKISVDLLNPDLVIMDEFQRFKFLISADEESDTGILAHRFLDNSNMKILLLSATPYKLYSTLEEINETQSDEHYTEFFQVMDFLLKEKSLQQEFKDVWNNYSVKLRELMLDNMSIIEVKKSAEDALYRGICRTERISAVRSGDFIDDSSVKKQLSITEKDILCFVQAQELLDEIGANFGMPVDYIKSSPYVLSFMKHYKLKQHLEKYFKEHPDEIRKAKKSLLWLDKAKLDNYSELDSTNARVEKLKESAFEHKAEMLLWIPPSKPYYDPQGVFKNATGFSKILVFSAWELVPRMIASLISYEAERKTVGKLSAQVEKEERKNARYFASNSKRYPVARLRFSVSDGDPKAMSLFCLLYPSRSLADCFIPIECLNQNKKLKDIERDLRNVISAKLEGLKRYQKISVRADDRWYYLAPLLMDVSDHVASWLNKGNELLSDKTADEEEKGQTGFRQHLKKLEDYYHEITEGSTKLGRMPDDLRSVLVDMAIASPAVCALRMNGGNSVNATQFSKIIINRLNLPEATAIIELCYGKTKNDAAYWRNVLRYFKDGNFQAVLDEYAHIIIESSGLKGAPNKYQALHNIMLDALTIHSSSYTVDTYETFKNSITYNNSGSPFNLVDIVKNKIGSRKEKGISLRSHYAVGFSKGEGDSSKIVNRKESIRNAFNSPFRPFILASTSIGQEGLDFHYYCRKIMHWNLPSNPIDLEQREGRINRFKCLAIRQNIASKYGNIRFGKDIWDDMFNEALKQEKDETLPELVPFWCLPDEQEIKIERIVPAYPLSRDLGIYERLIKILSLYRLTLGQARQEELLEYIFKSFGDDSRLKELFINLSPISKEKQVSI